MPSGSPFGWAGLAKASRSGWGAGLGCSLAV